jgi:hypothetical protein
MGHPVAGVRHRANMAWELGWTQQGPYPSQQHNRRQRRHRPQHGFATSQQDRQHSRRGHMSGDHAEAGRRPIPAMAMPGEAEQDVKRRLRCEQQGGDSAGGQPPVREGHACAGQQSRTEEKRSGGGETSAGNDVPGRGHKQAGSRQREAAKDSSPSARQRLHGHSLEAELSRRKGGSNVRFAQTDKPAGSAGAATVPNVASWDDVRRLALALPGTAEAPSHDGLPAWRVKDKLFVWERPLRRADYDALGDAAPDGPILGARVADVGVKEALLADQPDVYFTTPHFNGHPAVLVRLEQITVADLEEVVVEGWLDRAPRRIAEQYLNQRPERS